MDSYKKQVSAQWKVVPHAGDVDRNAACLASMKFGCVVPHAGDVDRNSCTYWMPSALSWSSPTRGTWIEMHRSHTAPTFCLVVPHAGDVDRNTGPMDITNWMLRVVPHAGDVDRNGVQKGYDDVYAGRPPRGGRG